MEDNDKDKEIERLNKIITVIVESSDVNNVCKICGREILPGQNLKGPSFFYQFLQGILIGFALLIFILIVIVAIAVSFF